MINYIKECDSDLIISTRVEITELLNKYYKGKGILISQEHAHHNNNQVRFLQSQQPCCS